MKLTKLLNRILFLIIYLAGLFGLFVLTSSDINGTIGLAISGLLWLHLISWINHKVEQRVKRSIEHEKEKEVSKCLAEYVQFLNKHERQMMVQETPIFNIAKENIGEASVYGILSDNVKKFLHEKYDQ